MLTVPQGERSRGTVATSIWVGVNMLNVTELDERIERCLAILSENPRSQVFAALADAYRKRGDVGRAFSICKSGIKQHPDYAPAFIVLAKLFLHQNMFDDAQAAVDKAIAIDGPTRASDLLQAEVMLALGDLDAAKTAIDRVRLNDPGNPAIRELTDRLRAARRKPAAARTPQPQTVHTETQEAPHPVPEPELPTAPDPISWEEWQTELRQVPHMQQVFAYSADGDALAGVGDSDDKLAGPTARMFKDIEDVVRDKLGVRLEEIRVENAAGEIWCRRQDDGLIGFVGSAGLPYGAARQTAVTRAQLVRGASQVDNNPQS